MIKKKYYIKNSLGSIIDTVYEYDADKALRKFYIPLGLVRSQLKGWRAELAEA